MPYSVSLPEEEEADEEAGDEETGVLTGDELGEEEGTGELLPPTEPEEMSPLLGGLQETNRPRATTAPSKPHVLADLVFILTYLFQAPCA